MKTKFLLLVLLSLIFQTHGLPTHAQLDSNQSISERPNVILMIGDGMGPEHLKLANLVEYGSENASIMQQKFPISYLYNTNNSNNEITDSAAGGTAITTGYLTANGIVSMDKSKSFAYKTLLEYLKNDFDYATGIVTTTEFTHATPAVFVSHTDNRDNKEAIRDALFDQGIDLILGGGRGVHYVGGAEGVKSMASQHGYLGISNIDELSSATNTSSKVLGLFGDQHMPYEALRNPSVDPSLIDLTEFSLKYFQSKEKPFFMMVEGGRIDHAGHLSPSETNKTWYNVLETITFEKSVRLATEFAESQGNTIVVVVADHETGGLKIHDYSNLTGELPSDDKSRIENNQIRYQRLQQIDATWSTISHTGVPVQFFGFGSDFGNYKIERITDVFWAINKALGSFPVTYIPQIFYNGSYMSITFVVDDLDKSAVSYQVVAKDEVQTIYTSELIPLNFETSTVTFETTEIQTNNSIRVSISVHDGNVTTTSLETMLPLTKPQATTASQSNFAVFSVLATFAILTKKGSRRYLYQKM